MLAMPRFTKGGCLKGEIQRTRTPYPRRQQSVVLKIKEERRQAASTVLRFRNTQQRNTKGAEGGLIDRMPEAVESTTPPEMHAFALMQQVTACSLGRRRTASKT